MTRGQQAWAGVVATVALAGVLAAVPSLLGPAPDPAGGLHLAVCLLPGAVLLAASWSPVRRPGAAVLVLAGAALAVPAAVAVAGTGPRDLHLATLGPWSLLAFLTPFASIGGGAGVALWSPRSTTTASCSTSRR